MISNDQNGLIIENYFQFEKAYHYSSSVDPRYPQKSNQPNNSDLFDELKRKKYEVYSIGSIDDNPENREKSTINSSFGVVSAHEDRKESYSIDLSPSLFSDIPRNIESKTEAADKNKNSSLFISPKSNALPTMCGTLKKKSPNFLQGWQERFCEIKNKKFMYYDPKNKERLVGCIDFDLVTVVVEEVEDNQFKISAYGSKKIFLFKAFDKAQREKWMMILKVNISHSEGAKRTITITSKIPLFWKAARISQADFLKKADTCDILLFRSKNIAAKLQRSVTGSDYDHVAILLRYEDGDIVLLEATGREGVGLCRWHTFMKNKWHLLYSRLIYRQLEIERTEAMISQVEEFNNLGKKYKFKASSIFNKKSNIPVNCYEDQSTYFCSELVAACYKKLKLLPKEIPSSSFWPGNFSSEKKLPLIAGVKLGPELLIDFTL